MHDPESSALIALSELQQLEAERVAQLAAEDAAARAATQQQQHAAEARAAEQVRIAAESAAQRAAAELAVHQQRLRDEQTRLQIAEVQARAELDARLQTEEMRIEAQIRQAERSARPKWPLVAVPILALVLAGTGWYALQAQRHAEFETGAAALARQSHDEESSAQAEAIAAIEAKLNHLEAERSGLLADLSQLDARLSTAQGETERAQLEARKTAVTKELDAVDARAKTGASRRRRGGSKTPRSGRVGKSGRTPRSTAEPENQDASSGAPDKTEKRRITLGDSRDPLSGI